MNARVSAKFREIHAPIERKSVVIQIEREHERERERGRKGSKSESRRVAREYILGRVRFSRVTREGMQ